MSDSSSERVVGGVKGGEVLLENSRDWGAKFVRTFVDFVPRSGPRRRDPCKRPHLMDCSTDILSGWW